MGDTPGSQILRHQPRTPGTKFETGAHAIGWDMKTAKFAEIVKDLSRNKQIPLLHRFHAATSEANDMKVNGKEFLCCFRTLTYIFVSFVINIV